LMGPLSEDPDKCASMASFNSCFEEGWNPRTIPGIATNKVKRSMVAEALPIGFGGSIWRKGSPNGPSPRGRGGEEEVQRS